MALMNVANSTCTLALYKLFTYLLTYYGLTAKSEVAVVISNNNNMIFIRHTDKPL